MELAKKDHVSVNQFIALAVAEKLSALGAEDILIQRGKRANRKDFLTVLNNVPDSESDEYDKI